MKEEIDNPEPLLALHHRVEKEIAFPYPQTRQAQQPPQRRTTKRKPPKH